MFKSMFFRSNYRKNLVRAHWFCLVALIGFLLICLHFLVNTLKQCEELDQSVHLSADQLVVSRRIVNLARLHVQSPSEQTQDALNDAIALFEVSQAQLMNTSNLPDQLVQLYFKNPSVLSLSDISSKFVADSRRIAMNPRASSGLVTLNLLQAVGAGALSNGLQDATQIYEAMFEAHLVWLGQLQYLTVFGTLFLLSLEIALFFWPSLRKALRSIEALEAETENLLKARRALVRQNEELVQARKRDEHNANHDSLTGLANRRYLDKKLNQRLRERAPNNGAIAIMHVDLDRFKQINDTLGHAAGDYILVHVASVLRQCVRASDFIARVGGDEFVILVNANSHPKVLKDIATRLIAQLGQPVMYEDTLCHFGASIGIDVQNARDLLEQSSHDSILINADIALYHAKHAGRGRYSFFTAELKDKFEHKKSLSDALIIGLEQDELLPLYQLQLDAKTQDIVGAEALVRWRHPQRGILLPEQFLDIARTLNLEHSIDFAILQKVMKDWKPLLAQGQALKQISVNLSLDSLKDSQLISQIEAARLPEGFITFEIDEGLMVGSDFEVVMSNVLALKGLGFAISIDNFGAGGTSLVAIKALMPNAIKLDPILIKDIARDQRQSAILNHVIGFVKAMGSDVIAQGVQTYEMIEQVQGLGVDYIQGFGVCDPMASSEFERKLSEMGCKQQVDAA